LARARVGYKRKNLRICQSDDGNKKYQECS